MFHANAWGLPYGGAAGRVEHRVPRAEHDPEGRRWACWSATASPSPRACRRSGWARCRCSRTTTCRRCSAILCGGSAVPRSLSEAYRTAHRHADPARLGHDRDVAGRHGREPAHAGRRTRTTTRGPTPAPGRASRCRWWSCAWSTRRPARSLPWDDETSGEIQAAGPWIAAQYYRDESGGAQFTDDGWLRTGDVATIDRYGSVRIVDRTKDLVKSGGEWISSVRAGERDHVAPEGGGGGRDRRARTSSGWSGRWPASWSSPARRSPPRNCARTSSRSSPRWWLPDAVEFIDEVPKTSVGKFSKRTLREKFAGYELPDSP